jgi:hypothetical protein
MAEGRSPGSCVYYRQEAPPTRGGEGISARAGVEDPLGDPVTPAHAALARGVGGSFRYGPPVSSGEGAAPAGGAAPSAWWAW